MTPLRVGILLDGPLVERWTARIVRGVLEDNRFDLALAVLNGERPARPALPARAWEGVAGCCG